MSDSSILDKLSYASIQQISVDTNQHTVKEVEKKLISNAESIQTEVGG